MNDPAGSDRSRRRRAVLATVAQSTAIVVLLVVVYYQAPLDRPLNVRSGVLFGLSLLLLTVVVAIEVRGIMRSDRPRLRAIRVLAGGVPLLLLVFASTYCTVDAGQQGAFTEPISRTDALYFTVTVFGTVGFGDIAPKTELARVLVTIQMIVGLLTVGVIARVVLGAVQVAESRRSRTGAPADPVPGFLFPASPSDDAGPDPAAPGVTGPAAAPGPPAPPGPAGTAGPSRRRIVRGRPRRTP